MLFAYTVVFELNRELPETELDALVTDLLSFRGIARDNGKINGFDDKLFNVYNNTRFNRMNEKFGGKLRVYFECESPADEDVANMCMLAQKVDAVPVHLSCKFKVGGATLAS